MNNSNSKYIEFKKKRELGDIITDVFAFLRTNYKPLFSVLFKTSGIALILLITSVGYYNYNYLSVGMLDPFGLNGGSTIFDAGNIIIALLVMIMSILVFYGVVFGTIIHYIKAYIHTGGNVEEKTITDGVRNDLGKILGLAIISTIIIILGTFFCFIPGIYLYVPMSLVFPILIFRNTGTFDAIGESFQLIKNEWWITFATLLVISILTYIISMIFSIPTIIYTMFKTFSMVSEGSHSDPSSMFDWGLIILNTISSLLQYIIMYVFTAISSAFIYFNLHERKYHTGTLEQIDTLGKSE